MALILLTCSTTHPSQALRREPGPVRIVELWASWCPGCRLAAESIERAQVLHPSVLVIVLDAHDPKLKQSLPGISLPYVAVLDRSGAVIGAIQGYTIGFETRLERLLSLVTEPAKVRE